MSDRAGGGCLAVASWGTEASLSPPSPHVVPIALRGWDTTGGSGIRLSFSARCSSAGLGLGLGPEQGAAGGGAGRGGPSRHRYKPVLRSEERARSAPRPRCQPRSTGQRWRLRGRGGNERPDRALAEGAPGVAGRWRLSRPPSLPPGSGSPAHRERLVRRAAHGSFYFPPRPPRRRTFLCVS